MEHGQKTMPAAGCDVVEHHARVGYLPLAALPA
jgi:hypothetical protein